MHLLGPLFFFLHGVITYTVLIMKKKVEHIFTLFWAIHILSVSKTLLVIFHIYMLNELAYLPTLNNMEFPPLLSPDVPFGR